MLDAWRETCVFQLCSSRPLPQDFSKVFCNFKGWLLQSWGCEMTRFEHELVSSLKDKPPSEPQNGVQDLHQEPEPSQRASSVRWQRRWCMIVPSSFAGYEIYLAPTREIELRGTRLECEKFHKCAPANRQTRRRRRTPFWGPKSGPQNGGKSSVSYCN